MGQPKKCRAPWHGLTQQRADCLGAQGLEVWSQGSWACHCFMPQTSAEEESPPQQMGELSPVPSHGPGLEVGRPRGPNYGPFLLGLLPPRRGSALAWRVGGHSCCGTKTGCCSGPDTGSHPLSGSSSPRAQRPQPQLGVSLCCPCLSPASEGALAQSSRCAQAADEQWLQEERLTPPEAQAGCLEETPLIRGPRMSRQQPAGGEERCSPAGTARGGHREPGNPRG